MSVQVGDDVTGSVLPGTIHPIKTTVLGSGDEIQHVRLDLGSGSAEAQATTSVPVNIVGGLVPEQYDELVLSYTGDDLTGVIYKLNTVTIATLTLSYTGTNLTGVVRS